VTTKSDVEHFRFQKDLIKLLSIMVPIGKSLNPFYLAQFNQDYSWTCDAWQNIGRCTAVNQLNENIEMIQPKRQKTMFGKIHDACGILAKVQDLQDRYNSMAIFIISHYFGTSGMADDHSDIAFCSEVFPTRLAILTGNADEVELSTVANSVRKVEDDEYHATALTRLTECMRDSCCVEFNSLPPNTCISSKSNIKNTETYSRNQ